MLGARCMVQLLSAENFWQCGSSALQKKPFAARYLPFATIHSHSPVANSLFAVVLAWQKLRPPGVEACSLDHSFDERVHRFDEMPRPAK